MKKKKSERLQNDMKAIWHNRWLLENKIACIWTVNNQIRFRLQCERSLRHLAKTFDWWDNNVLDGRILLQLVVNWQSFIKITSYPQSNMVAVWWSDGNYSSPYPDTPVGWNRVKDNPKNISKSTFKEWSGPRTDWNLTIMLWHDNKHVIDTMDPPV